MTRSPCVRASLLVSLAILAGCAKGPAVSSGTGDTSARLFNDLGTHSHKVTTSSPRAQQYFDQGLRLAYAFNHDEGRVAFKEAARIDPDCAMCWWGIAYTLGTNYNLPADPERDKEAWTAIEKARGAAPHATERERAYVEAIAKRFVQNPPANRYPLDEAWANAIGEVAKRYPDDLDAGTIHAEALMNLQPWDLWTHDGQPKGRTLEIVAELERVLKADPQHPGANHYYIHAVEASMDPGRAGPAADRLRAQNLGTGAGHLVHMPSHIYVRTGRYAHATEANAKAIAVDEAYIQKWDIQGDYAHMYYPHNVHFRAFSAGMEGRSTESIENARKVAGFLTPDMMAHMPMLEGIGASTYFTRVRFARWDEVLAEPAPEARLKYLNAIRHWARGIAYVAKGRLGEAKTEERALDAIWAKMPPDKLSTQVNKGKDLLGVADNQLAGMIAAKRKKWDEAVRRLETAVKLEDSLVYMEPADWFDPVRPFLGAILLEAGRPSEAEAVYRGDLRHNPDNGWSLHGLETSLARQGKTAESTNVEYTLLKKDGTAIPVELSSSVLLDRTGKPQGFIAVWRDISARKQAEAAALGLAAIVESSYDAIIGKTLDGAITSWNAAAERMYGYSAAEIIGQPISLLAPAEAAAELREILVRVKQGERIRDYETVRSQKDGTAIHVSLTVSPIRDAAQNIIGASTIARDISDRKALEQLHADFIASLTHDIRGPVGNIGGYLELLRDEQGLSAKAQEIIAVMESSVQTTLSLITNYLDQARIEAGRLSLAKGPVALDELLTRVVRQYEVVAARRDITVSLQVEPAPPPLEGDTLALERVFANLVHNAFKFTPNGGCITVSTWHEDGSVAVSVADTGPGIPADDIPSLFERYQRTATGRSQVGTGLGLFIAKSLVEAHGGMIRVETRDRGSCFTVLLPFMRMDAPEAATSS